MKCEDERMQMQLRLDASVEEKPAKRRPGRPESMGAKVVVPGNKYGMLTVIGVEVLAAKYQTKWRYRCDCGKDAVVRASSLLRGIVSCGCNRVKQIGRA